MYYPPHLSWIYVSLHRPVVFMSHSEQSSLKMSWWHSFSIKINRTFSGEPSYSLSVFRRNQLHYMGTGWASREWFPWCWVELNPLNFSTSPIDVAAVVAFPPAQPLQSWECFPKTLTCTKTADDPDAHRQQCLYRHPHKYKQHSHKCEQGRWSDPVWLIRVGIV